MADASNLNCKYFWISFFVPDYIRLTAVDYMNQWQNYVFQRNHAMWTSVKTIWEKTLAIYGVKDVIDFISGEVKDFDTRWSHYRAFAHGGLSMSVEFELLWGPWKWERRYLRKGHPSLPESCQKLKTILQLSVLLPGSTRSHRTIFCRLLFPCFNIASIFFPKKCNVFQAGKTTS